MAQDSPSETKHLSTPLFRVVSRQRTLDDAWRHVRERASGSPDELTRQEWAQIEKDPRLYISRLQRDLTSGKFQYARQRGVLKRRAAKSPRPIVVSPLRNRIVQRALLSVCQSDQQSLVAHLGDIPRRLAIETSVGGLPGRGARDAIRLIREAISNGATHYVRSDIKDFFIRLPRPKVDALLKDSISDTRFLNLLLLGLTTELSNSEIAEIRDHWDLFPSSELGVPQGSSLSALCANLLLGDFDKQMNGRGIVTIRYLDDLLILAPSAAIATRAWQSAKRHLASLGLIAHDPQTSSKKAGRGTIADGFEFLSFRITATDVVPSKAARLKLVSEVDASLRGALGSLRHSALTPRRAEDAFVQTISRLDRKIRGWGDAFQDTSQRVVFRQMDERLTALFDREAASFLSSLRGVPADQRRRMWGVALLADTKQVEPVQGDIRPVRRLPRKAAP